MAASKAPRRAECRGRSLSLGIATVAVENAVKETMAWSSIVSNVPIGLFNANSSECLSTDKFVRGFRDAAPCLCHNIIIVNVWGEQGA